AKARTAIVDEGEQGAEAVRIEIAGMGEVAQNEAPVFADGDALEYLLRHLPGNLDIAQLRRQVRRARAGDAGGSRQPVELVDRQPPAPGLAKILKAGLADVIADTDRHAGLGAGPFRSPILLVIGGAAADLVVDNEIEGVGGDQRCDLRIGNLGELRLGQTIGRLARAARARTLALIALAIGPDGGELFFRQIADSLCDRWFAACSTPAHRLPPARLSAAVAPRGCRQRGAAIGDRKLLAPTAASHCRLRRSRTSRRARLRCL